MTISGLISGLAHRLGLTRYLGAKRHRTETTDYAAEANDMARRNLKSVLRKRDPRHKSETIAACLEACFPLAGEDEAPQRLRDAVTRLKDETPPRP